MAEKIVDASFTGDGLHLSGKKVYASYFGDESLERTRRVNTRELCFLLRGDSALSLV